MQGNKKRTRSQASRYAVAKGKDYERRIARILSEWWGSPLRRIRSGEEDIYSGDIVDEAGQFPFIVECKKREEWNLLDLLRPELPLSSYWSQAYNDYIDNDPHHKPSDPVLLIFSKKRGRNYFMMRRSALRAMEKYCGDFPFQYLIAPYAEGQFEQGIIAMSHAVIGRLTDFLDHFLNDMIKTIPAWRRE